MKRVLGYIIERLNILKDFNLSDSQLSFRPTRESIAPGINLQFLQPIPQETMFEKERFDSSLDKLYRKGIHGIEHAYRVLKLVQKISELEKISQDQKLLLEFCAIFHDIGRINDYIDNNHGIRSIKKLEKDNYFGWYAFNNPYVKYIIENHCISDDFAFKNISKYGICNKPVGLFLIKIFKDADNLDRVRLGDFDEKYLRNKSAKEIQGFALELFEETCLF